MPSVVGILLFNLLAHFMEFSLALQLNLAISLVIPFFFFVTSYSCLKFHMLDIYCTHMQIRAKMDRGHC